MKWTTLLEDLSASNPIAIFTLALFFLMFQKIAYYLINVKKLEYESQREHLDNLKKSVEILKDRCTSLEKELIEWREKYYEIKKTLDNLIKADGIICPLFTASKENEKKP